MNNPEKQIEKEGDFKKFLRLRAEGSAQEAYAVAQSIAISNYPKSIRQTCLKYTQENAHSKPPSTPSQYSKNLYEAIRNYKPLIDESLAWAPINLISKHPNHPEIENSLTQEEIAWQFIIERKDLLDTLNTNDIGTICNTIESFFDHVHYTAIHSDMRGASRSEALEHYAANGSTEANREPNALFRNSEFYDLYPWAKQVRINPLLLFSSWPQEFSKYVEIITRRYRVAQVIGQELLSRLSKLEPGTRVISRTHTSRAVSIAREQSRFPRLISRHNQSSLDIHFVIPDFTPGGGGHMTIFRLVKYLEATGNTCTLWVKDYDYRNHPAGARHSAKTYYQDINANVIPLSAQFGFAFGDALIATSWDTVELTLSNKNFIDHFYLVQDYEPFFYARGSRALQAEQTYSQDIKMICASTWLDEIMKTKHGKKSTSFDLAFNPDVYYSIASKEQKRPAFPCNANSASACVGSVPVVKIAFYARSRTERRAVELALAALQLIEHRKYDFCVNFFGEERGRVVTSSNVCAIDHGILTPDELADLYRSCDIGLTFSATNYALVPQEMMACGLAVIEIDNESTRAIYPQETCLLSKPTPAYIAKAIDYLAGDQSARDRISRNGLRWVNQFSWNKSFKTVETFIKTEINSSKKPTHPSINAYYCSLPHNEITLSQCRAPLVSVVIPSLNGGPLLIEAARRVLSQRLDENYELLVLDSQSADGSIEQLPEDERLSLYEIDQSDFQHGRSRNLAIALSRGKYVALLTQDALPADENWLSNIIQPLRERDEIVAVFGRHIAHHNHSHLTAKALEQHFHGFKETSSIHNISNSLEKYWAPEPTYRQFMHFYSDNNSCIKKDFWERHPYPDVEYGEDQLLAEWIAQSQSTKAYAHDAVVMHSHQYTYQEEHQRCKTEAFFFAKYFGYDLSQDRVAIERGVRTDLNSIDKNESSILSEAELSALIAAIRAKPEGYLAGLTMFWDWLKASEKHT
jgi:glycosyltransferase involved in cell wall biosynthesis